MLFFAKNSVNTPVDDMMLYNPLQGCNSGNT